MTAAQHDADPAIHFHDADQALTFQRRSRGGMTVSLTPDRALDYGYDDAGTRLTDASVARLRHWLNTGQALPRDAPPPPAVDAALDTLRAAGWDVRTDTGHGSVEGGILVLLSGVEHGAAPHARIVARQPWTPTTRQDPTC